MGLAWECWEEWVKVNLKSSLAASRSRKSLASTLASRGGSVATLGTGIPPATQATQSLVYGSRCSGNHSRHSKLVDTGISHSLQQQLFLDNVLTKRNTKDKNVRVFSSITYAGPCTTVNSAFKLTTHLQSNSREKSPSLRFHFNNHW